MKQGTLASRNIRVLFWAELFGSVRFIQPVLALFYFSRGLDEADILWLLLFWSIGVLVGEIPTGMFADRYGAKLSFVIGALLSIVSHGLLIWAYDPWLFFASSLLSGFSVTFFSGADEAFIYESLKESNEENMLDKALGIIQSAQFMVMVVVLILGAIIAKDLTDGQFKLLIGLGVFFQIIQIVLLCFIKNPAGHGSYQENPFKQVKEGMLAIKKAPQLVWMFLNITLVFIPTVAIFNNFNDKLLRDAGLPVYLIGFVLAGLSIFSFFVSRSIGWMTSRISRIALLYITGGIAVFSLLLAAFFRETLWILFIIMMLIHFVGAVRYPVYAQLANDIIPSNVRATTISLLSIIDSICDLVVFSSIASIAAFGFETMFLGAAVIAIIGSLLPIHPVTIRKNES
ncbi:MFS transporter [Roseburia sp. 1XD42-34]|uniref:MFS transporter n=1 Tax=Roseburia sp. 1XD42-34 TaxID=2305905 RepID=UPI000EA19AB4|nr:MFS transporter [Roseburia sp. 1XD42-34]NBJ71308.1 MFS transporter [Roseburia sp. 1XD42-34]RKI74715.1 MFS transporter [Clostridium sp. 1xD42-85]